MTFMTFLSSLHHPGDRSLRRSQSRHLKSRPDPTTLSFPTPPRDSKGIYQTFHTRYGFPPTRSFPPSHSHPFPGNLPSDWPLQSADYYTSFRPREGYVQIGGHVRGVKEREYRKARKSGRGRYQATRGDFFDEAEYGGWGRAGPPMYSSMGVDGGYPFYPRQEVRDRRRGERELSSNSSEESVDSALYVNPVPLYDYSGRPVQVEDYSHCHGGWGGEKGYGYGH